MSGRRPRTSCKRFTGQPSTRYSGMRDPFGRGTGGSGTAAGLWAAGVRAAGGIGSRVMSPDASMSQGKGHPGEGFVEHQVMQGLV